MFTAFNIFSPPALSPKVHAHFIKLRFALQSKVSKVLCIVSRTSFAHTNMFCKRLWPFPLCHRTFFGNWLSWLPFHSNLNRTFLKFYLVFGLIGIFIWNKLESILIRNWNTHRCFVFYFWSLSNNFVSVFALCTAVKNSSTSLVICFFCFHQLTLFVSNHSEWIIGHFTTLRWA